MAFAWLVTMLSLGAGDCVLMARPAGGPASRADEVAQVLRGAHARLASGPEAARCAEARCAIEQALTAGCDAVLMSAVGTEGADLWVELELLDARAGVSLGRQRNSGAASAGLEGLELASLVADLLRPPASSASAATVAAPPAPTPLTPPSPAPPVPAAPKEAVRGVAAATPHTRDVASPSPQDPAIWVSEKDYARYTRYRSHPSTQRAQKVMSLSEWVEDANRESPVVNALWLTSPVLLLVAAVTQSDELAGFGLVFAPISIISAVVDAIDVGNVERVVPATGQPGRR